MKLPNHPIQPLFRDDGGVIRFRPNKIVKFLLDAGQFDMNKLALIEFSDQDRMQFAQLIGYSVGGYSELDYVSDKNYTQVTEIENKFLVDNPIKYE
jgi:hypothetical protein